MSLQQLHVPAAKSHLVLLHLHSAADHHVASCLTLYPAACRSSPVIDMVPTFTTSNERICLLMTNGQMGSLRIEDAERLQVACFPGRCISCSLGSPTQKQLTVCTMTSHTAYICLVDVNILAPPVLLHRTTRHMLSQQQSPWLVTLLSCRHGILSWAVLRLGVLQVESILSSIAGAA